LPSTFRSQEFAQGWTDLEGVAVDVTVAVIVSVGVGDFVCPMLAVRVAVTVSTGVEVTAGSSVSVGVTMPASVAVGVAVGILAEVPTLKMSPVDSAPLVGE
jgi:hypothetical protein